MSSVLQAIGAPRRREILRLIWSEERAAGDIHRSLGDVTFGAVSQNLKVLEGAGLVSKRSDGQRRLYLARKDQLGPFAQWLEEMWDSALYRLKLHAELEQSRRGPRRRKKR